MRVAPLTRMTPEPGRWCRLIPATIADLPNAAGVFEVANLVRNVLYIARAEGSLRDRLSTVMQTQEKLPPSAGGYYFRYEITADEDASLSSRLSAYRLCHSDMLPPANRSGRLLHAVSRHAA